MDEQEPTPQPEPSPEDTAPQDAPDGGNTPATDPPPSRVLVRYDAPLNSEAPIKRFGLWWHDRTHFVLAADDGANLAKEPGFSVTASAD